MKTHMVGINKKYILLQDLTQYHVKGSFKKEQNNGQHNIQLCRSQNRTVTKLIPTKKNSP